MEYISIFILKSSFHLMNGGGAGTPEPNPNQFRSGLDFNFPSMFEFEAKNENYLRMQI